MSKSKYSHLIPVIEALREAGWRWVEIDPHLGLPNQTAYQLMRRHRLRQQKNPNPDVETSDDEIHEDDRRIIEEENRLYERFKVLWNKGLRNQEIRMPLGLSQLEYNEFYLRIKGRI